MIEAKRKSTHSEAAESLEDICSELRGQTKLAYQAAASGRDDDLQAALDRREGLIKVLAEAASTASPQQIRAAVDCVKKVQAMDAELAELLAAQRREATDQLGLVRAGRRMARGSSRSRNRSDGAIFNRNA